MHLYADHELTRAQCLAHLRAQVRELETGFRKPAGHHYRLAGLENAFADKAFPVHAVHEFVTPTRQSVSATNGFIASMLHSLAYLQAAPWIIWITKSREIFAPGLKAFGLDPSRIIFIELPQDKHVFWTMEEALKCDGLGAVIAEVADADLTTTRRLQLAVEKSGVMGVLIRRGKKQASSSACVARWRIEPLPSQLDDGVPGVGFPRWHVTLERAKNGQPAEWALEWRGKAFHNVRPQKAESVSQPSLATGTI